MVDGNGEADGEAKVDGASELDSEGNSEAELDGDGELDSNDDGEVVAEVDGVVQDRVPLQELEVWAKGVACLADLDSLKALHWRSAAERALELVGFDRSDEVGFSGLSAIMRSLWAWACAWAWAWAWACACACACNNIE